MEETKKEQLGKPSQRPKKFGVYNAPLFIGLWLALYVGIVLNRLNALPEALTIEDVPNNPERFIAERAESNLVTLTSLGPRITGSYANEVQAVEFLTDEIKAIIRKSRKDLYDIEYNVQKVSGGYMHWDMWNSYRGIQNVVVKLKPKNSTRTSCVLINSHFDSAIQSPGAGDDGAMVVVSLEVLRTMSVSSKPLRNSIVFLFNGAEENPLQGSHAFITQHKWAKDIKTVINLDAAGSGGKEVLFQSGPNHPWIVKYYAQYAKYPCGTTLGEEVFQAGLVSSDTDFRIFRDFGHVPGLDMAYYKNGYHYHTKYDTIHNIERGSLQNTGENILALARGLANAPELENIEAFKEGSAVFYDILGLKMIVYTKSQGELINLAVAIATLLVIAASLGHMAEKANISFSNIVFKMILVQVLEIVSLALAVGLVIGVTHIMGYLHLPSSWYYNEWMAICLYGCPIVCGLGIVPALYLGATKHDRVTLGHRTLMFAHAHCIILIVALLALTYLNIRSAYLPMISVLFYGGTLIFSLITSLHDRNNLWIIPAILGQIGPFLYFTYLGNIILTTMIPMGTPELQIAVITALFSILSVGFLVPILLLFKKSKTILISFLIVTAMAIAFASTPSGFRFREKESPEIMFTLHARRVFHDQNGAIRRNEPVIYLRQTSDTLEAIAKNGTNFEIRKVADECPKEMACGFPYYNHRWFRGRESAVYIRTSRDPILPEMPRLTMVEKITNEKLAVVKYKLRLVGPDHMGILIQPNPMAKLINWSFNDTMLRTNRTIPYYVYLSSGIPANEPYNFDLEFQKTKNVTSPSFEIGVIAHWTHRPVAKAPEYEEFLSRFPKYTYPVSWVASYESWIY